MGLADKRATFMRRMRFSVVRFLTLLLVVSTLSAISFVTAPSSHALSNTNCEPTLASGLVGSGVISSSDCIVTITSGSGTWTVPTGVSTISILVVGGGGGGGADAGGGGGGGELRSNSTLSVTSGASASIAIGAGGAGGSWLSSTTSSAGTATTITGAFTFTANAGSGGGGWTTTVGGAGGSGGSGGSGNNGGAGGGGPGTCSASGTGILYFGAVGSNGPSTTVINSSAVNYAGGGGGGLGAQTNNVGTAARGSTGGTGGGGRGANYKFEPGDSTTSRNGASAGQAGTTNTGGGGGAGSACNAHQDMATGIDGFTQRTAGGVGGSGVVILKYRNPPVFPANSFYGTVSEGQSLTLTATPGNVFTSVEFASYGTPINYTQGSCHASASSTPVSNAFLGKNSSSISANNAIFTDPCGGTYKSLSVVLLSGPQLSVTTPSTGLSGVFDSPYTLNLSASGGAGTKSFAVTTGSLPSGLTLNSSTGVISGTPTTVGTSSIVVTVTDSPYSVTALTSSFSLVMAAGAALTPTFGSPTATADGFTVQISNYSANYTWAGTATASGTVAINGTGLVTVTGVAAGTSSTATITTTRTSYTGGSATASATSITGAALTPTFGSPTATATGFTVQISNYSANYTWAGTATASGTVAINGTGLVTVTGVAAGTSSTATITTTRTGYSGGSATVTATSTVGSAQFGGTADRSLTVANGGDFAVGTGDFTVEWWQRMTAAPTGNASDVPQSSWPRVFSLDSTFQLSIENYPDPTVYLWLGGSAIGLGQLSSFSSNYQNRWTHFALSRTSTTVRLFINGSLLGSATSSGNITNSTDPLYIGRQNADKRTLFPGQITNFHFVKGFSKYTTNFSTPTARTVPISNSKLLLQFEANGNLTTDSSGQNKSVTNNNAITFSSESPSWTSDAAALTPTFGTPTATADGFTVQISNYNASYTWAGTATASGTVAINGTGLVTVTGVAQGTSSTATITTTRTGYTGGSETVSATSTAGAALTPAFGSPTATANGFTVQISNYSASYTWAGTATASGTVAINGTGLVTVTGVAPGTSSTATITTTRTGYTGGSATVSGTAFSNISTLSAMNISSGTLSPTFASGTTTYTASVANAVTAITVTPTRTQANATITVNGTTVASASASGNLALSVGANIITVVITAQDGTTATTYTVTITRLASAVAPTIGTQPIAASKTVGQSVTFTVVATASDSGVLSYQWQKGGVDISGGTSSTYTIASTVVSDAGNYQVVVTNTQNSTTATTTSTVVALTMSKATPTFSWNNVTKIFGDSTFTVTAPTVTGSLAGTFTYSSGTVSVITISGTTLTVVAAGSSVITASFTPTNSTDFNTASTTMTVTVNKATQTVSWAPTTSYATTASPVTPSVAATALGLAPITYSVTNAGTTGCSVNSSTGVLTFTTVGSCTVQSSAATTSNYESATSNAIFVISLGPRTLTIDSGSYSSTYVMTAAAPTLTSTASAGAGTKSYTSTITAVCTVVSSTGVVTFVGIGTCTISATIAADSSYSSATSSSISFAITLATQTVTWSPTLSLLATGSPVTPSALATALGLPTITYAVQSAGSSGCTINSTTAVLTFTAPGSCTVRATAAATVSYTAGSIDAVFTISAVVLSNAATPTVTATAGVLKSLGVTWSSITNASSYTLKIYNTAGSTLLETVTALSGTSKTITAGEFAAIADGTAYQISITAIGTGNYSSSSESTKATVTTAGSFTLTYSYNGATGGNGTVSSSFITGATAITLPTPTKTGYTLDGWYVASDLSGTKLNSTYSPTQTSTIYAKWNQVVNGSLLFLATSNSYLSIPNSESLKFRTGNFTVEWWQYQTDSLSWPRIFESLSGATREIGVSIESNTFYWWSGGVALCRAGVGTGNKNSWHHFAVARSSTTTKVFKDGTQLCSFSDAKDYQPTGVLKFGAEIASGANTYFGGNITNFHWVTGTALYSSAFTVGDSPVTLVANSKLLLNVQNQSNLLVDLTGLNTVNNNGNNVSWSSMSPFTIKSATFNANGGTGTMTNQSITVGTATALSTNTFTRSGYSFTGWNTAANASGSSYTNAESVTISESLALYAQWSANTLTLTYDSRGGSAVTGTTVATGGSISSAPAAPTSAGYTFNGWFVATSGGTVITFAYSPANTSSFTLYAQWSATTQSVTYALNGGSGSTPTQANVATAATFSLAASTGLTKAGYTFGSWSDGATTSAAGATYTMGASAITLTAQWTATTQSVTYALNGGAGTLPTQAGVATAATFTLAASTGLTKSGYTFGGWSNGATTSSASATYTMGSSNITLTAQWTVISLVITFDSQGGSAVSAGGVNFGASISAAPTAPTRAGYTFSGWSATSAGSAVTFPYAHGQTTNFTLYAIWTVNTLTVSYSTYGGTAVSSGITTTAASIAIAPAAPTKANYTFTGWSATDGGSAVTFPLTHGKVADFTLHGLWSANQYVLTYAYNSATGDTSTATANFTTGGSPIVLPTPTRTGYIFAGWFSDSLLSASIGAAGGNYSPTGSSLTPTAYAKWTPINYTVTYSATTATSGAVPTDATNYNIGNSVVIKANSGTLVRTGYSFTGWTYASDGTGSPLNSGSTYTTQTTNMTFYAKWSPNSYTVTYNKNGATGSPAAATSSYTTAGTAVTLTSVNTMVKTGFDFSGWSATPTGSVLSGTYTTAEDVTLHAIWIIKSIALTFDKGIASGVTVNNFPANTSLNYGATLTLASDLTSAVVISGTYYAFAGWTNAGNIYQGGTTFLIGETAPTFTAEWVKVFAVRYSLNGGTAAPSSSEVDSECISVDGSDLRCTENQDITVNAAPSRAGYTFTGWTNQGGIAVTAAAITRITSTNYLFYANWTPINYTITYNTVGGSTAAASFTKQKGQSFTLESAPTKTGYNFVGWNDGSTTFGVGVSYIVATSPVTSTAQWSPKVYSVIYDWNGGSGSSTNNDAFTVGASALTLPSVGDHVKDGYTFAGWSTTSNGTLISGGYTPTGDATLFAIWGTGSYTLSYNANGGTVSTASASVLNGSSLTLPTPTRANFVFEGWYSASTGGASIGAAGANFQPAQSRTIFARWTQASLYGLSPSVLSRIGTTTASNSASSVFTSSNPTSSVSVTVPAGALPLNTTVNFDLVGDFSRAQSLLAGTNSYIVSLLVSWLAPDGTVPNTTAGNGISVTISNSSIKAGASVYGIVSGNATLLGTATENGTVTVTLLSDPEVVVVATKPAPPTNLAATSSGVGQIALTWSAPASDGGSVITGYTVTGNGDATCTAATTSCTIAGLLDGTTYIFTVTATNVIGLSDLSASARTAGAVVVNSSSAPVESTTSNRPETPRNVTIVSPVTVIGSKKAKVSIFEVSVSASGPDPKPAAIKIDAASDKFIAEVKVVEGKLVLTPETGFSGKKTVTVAITENGVDRLIQIPLTVLPEAVMKPVLTPTSANKSVIRWAASPNADAYTVYLNGRKVCSTAGTNCSIGMVLGPNAVIEIISNGGDRTESKKVEADFKQTAPVVITRLVGRTLTKSMLTEINIKALDKAIALLKSQGFRTVQISELTTTGKTKKLADARITSIKEYIASKFGSDEIKFEVTPVTSKTYFNNISVKE